MSEKSQPAGAMARLRTTPAVVREDGAPVGRLGAPHDGAASLTAEERLGERAARLELLAEAMAQLMNAANPDTVVRELFPKVAEHLGADSYFNFMVDPTGTALQLHSYAGITEAQAAAVRRLEFGQAICGTVARERRPIIACDIQHSNFAPASVVRGFGLQAYACHPLLVAGTLLGTLSFASHTRAAFEPDDVEFMAIISQYTAVALDRLRTAGARQRLAAIIESSDDAIVSKNLDGIVTSWNRGAERLFGYPAAEMIGRSITLLVPADRQDEEPAIIQRIRSGERVDHLETVRRRKDGSFLDVLLIISPIRDANGVVIGASKIAHDITARKLAETHATFLDQLTHQLSSLTTPDAIIAQVSETVGRHLRADRCYLPQWPAGEAVMAITHDYHTAALPSLAGQHLLSDAGPRNWQHPLRKGPIVIADFDREPASTGFVASGHAAGLRSLAISRCAPGERSILALAVAGMQPRAWTDADLGLLHDVIQRVAPMIDRVRIQENLRESEARLRHAFEAANMGAWRVDLKSGLCTRDAAVNRTYGLEAVDSVTPTGDVLPLIHPGDRALVEQAWQRVLGGEVYAVEYRMVQRDGAVRWLREQGRAMTDAQGRSTIVTGVTLDITEQKRAQDALRARELQLRAVADSAPVFLAQIDRDHRFRFVNRSYAARYRRAPEDFIGRHIREIAGDGPYQQVRPHLETALTGQSMDFEMEINYELPLGRRWIHATYTPERDGDDRVIGLVVVINDTTLRKQAELELEQARDKALAASSAKDDFLAALSHELRTPLNPVLLLASDSAANLALPAAVRADFELIRKNVDLEARLIDDLLDLTRITRGKLPLEMRPVALHGILEDALATVQGDVEAKRLTLAVKFAPENSQVSGDAVRLQQVLWNVLKNAVKFTPEGGRISVRTEHDAPAAMLRIHVADTGIGMTRAERERAFESFAQGEHATKNGPHRFGGLGLGLSISRMLVERHSGRIYAHSEGRDRGSEFIIELPLLASGKETRSPMPKLSGSPPPFSTEGSTGLRVLLVEDHAPTRTTLSQVLTRRNYQVRTAGSVAEALSEAAGHPFDLVVSDIGLPDGDGYELMAALLMVYPHLRGIALSGYGMESDVARSRLAGFGEHLTKPVNVAALEKSIARLGAAPAPPN